MEKTNISIFILILFSFLFLFGCHAKRGSQNDKTSKEILEPDTSQNTDIETRRYLTKSGLSFFVIEDKSAGASISNLRVYTKDFEIINDTTNFGKTDPIQKVLQTDLNNDGYEELFITSGSGSHGKLYGLASNRDKSVSMIYIPGIEKAQLIKGKLFEGYMGHDSISVVDNVLINTFPVYNAGDTNSNPTGGIVSVHYSLIKGEASFILRAIKRVGYN